MRAVLLAVRGLVFRRARSAMVFLIAVLAVTAAVVGPAYGRAAEQTVLADALAAAPPAEVGVSVRRVGERVYRTEGSYVFRQAPASALAKEADPYVDRRYYATAIGGASLTVQVDGPAGARAAGNLVYRQDVCAHVRVDAGTCRFGSGSVLVSTRSTAQLGLEVGSRLVVAPQREVGRPRELVVTGTYTPLDVTSDYWFGRPFFLSGVVKVGEDVVPQVDALLTAESDVQAVESASTVSADYLLRRSAVGLDDLPALRTGSQRARRLSQSGASVDSRVGSTLDMVQRNRDLVALSVPLVVLQLVLVCWYVLFLVVADSTEERGPEIALAGLRGHSARSAAMFGLAEPVVLLVLAVPVGLLLGLATVEMAARVLLGDAAHVELRLPVFATAAVALVGALAATVLAARRTVSRPVASLLRRVPSRTARWRAGIAEGAAGALAVAAVVQLVTDRGRDASPVALLTPSLVALVLGLAASALLPGLARSRASNARRHGRLSGLLAWTALARRPAARRVAVVVTVAVALLVFAADAWEVADRNRTDRAATEVGAAQVLTVRAASQQRLLEGVRAADPGGRQAMAVTLLVPSGGSGAAYPVLAVDSTRWAAVAEWRGSYADRTPREIESALRPPAEPVAVVRGPVVTVDLHVEQVVAVRPVRLQLLLVTPERRTVQADLGRLQTGRTTRTARLAGCAQGCRVAGLTVTRFAGDFEPILGRFTVLAVADNGRPLRLGLDGRGAWRTPPVSAGQGRATILRSEHGLAVAFSGSGAEDLRVLHADAPAPLPALVAGPLPGAGQVAAAPGAAFTSAGLDGVEQDYTQVAAATVLPRLGRRGLVVDLGYADRLADGYERSVTDQVWLSPAAPADVAARLRRHGIEVVEVESVAARERQLDREGPALALRLYLIAALAGLLLAAGTVGIAAHIGGGVRTYELAALRSTGVPARTLRGALLREHATLVGVGLSAGVLAGAVGATLALPAVPLFAEPVAVPVPTYRPGLTWVAVALVVALLVLTVASGVVVSGLLRRAGPDRLREGP